MLTLSKFQQAKVWVEKRPYLFHAFAYIVILIVLGLIINSNSSTRTQIKEIQRLDPCIQYPNGEACSKDLSELVRNLTADQSLVVLCKALRAVGNPCVTKTDKNGDKETDVKGTVGGNSSSITTPGTDKSGDAANSQGGSESGAPPAGEGTQGPNDSSPPEQQPGGSDGDNPPAEEPPNEEPPEEPPTNNPCDINVLNACVGIPDKVGPVEVPLP